MKTIPNRGYFDSLKLEYKALFLKCLKPNEYCAKVEDIELDALLEKGYDTIFLDVDNTILPYGKRELSIRKDRWVQELKNKVVIGDQLLTDVLFGNLIGARSILVSPLNIEKNMIRRFQRHFESWALKEFGLT